MELTLSISSDVSSNTGGTKLYASPPLNQYSYKQNESNYSAPVPIQWTGSVAVPATAAGMGDRLQLGFQNNDRNLQVLLPFTVTVTCDGESDDCFIVPPAPKPVPPPPPLPPGPPPPPKNNRPWNTIGPHNIGDDIYGRGEAGTIAAAVSIIGNPNLIYMGGNNNAAASGVLKSTDMGAHWTKMNVGLFDTRLLGLHIVDDDGDGDHVLAGTLSGVFETLDGAQTWTYVDAVSHHGVASSFRNGTINGKPTMFVGMSAGLVNVPIVKNGPMVNLTWSMIPSPPGSAYTDFDINLTHPRRSPSTVGTTAAVFAAPLYSCAALSTSRGPMYRANWRAFRLVVSTLGLRHNHYYLLFSGRGAPTPSTSPTLTPMASRFPARLWWAAFGSAATAWCTSPTSPARPPQSGRCRTRSRVNRWRSIPTAPRTL